MLPIEPVPSLVSLPEVVPLSVSDANVHMALAGQLRLDGYDAILRHAARRKLAFDRRVEASRAGHVTF